MLRLLYQLCLKSKNKIQIHFLCWLIFISYEMIMASFIVTGIPYIHYLLFYLINIGIFYLHSFFLFNYLSANKRINLLRIPLFLILEIIVYGTAAIAVSFFLNWFVYDKPRNFDFLTYKYTSLTLYRGGSFMLYATGYYFLINYIKKTEKTLTQTIENEQLKNELLRAEQDFLRAQINPHLLFNTLSFIKYAAKKKPEEADEAIMRLSDIMGFALESNSEVIPLTKELEQVENIIELNQLRFNHNLKLNYLADLHSEEVVIIPILLLTLVENVFKHGNLLDEEHVAEIRIKSTEEYLLLQTANLPNINKSMVSNKTGLINIKLRLEQFYKNNYHFNYGISENGLFKLEIKINL